MGRKRLPPGILRASMRRRRLNHPPQSPLWLRSLLALPAIIAALLSLVGVTSFERVEGRLYDEALVPLLPKAPQSDLITIVEVDENTLQDLGERWPLQRRTWAQFLRQLATYQPKGVAIDVLFDQPGENRIATFVQDAQADIASLPSLPSDTRQQLHERLWKLQAAHDGDRQLSEALAALGPVTLGLIAHNNPFLSSPASPIPVFPGIDSTEVTLRSHGIIASAPNIFLSAQAHGTMNVITDRDGVVRRYPYAIAVEDQVVPSLALSLASISGHLPPHSLTAALRDGASPHLRYRRDIQKRSPWPRVSFSDILYATDGDTLAALDALLRDRYILIGSSAPGLEDLLRTPVALARPGIEIHATALDNILVGKTLSRGGFAPWLNLLVTLLFVSSFIAFLHRPRRLPIFFLSLLIWSTGALAAAIFTSHFLGLLILLVPIPLALISIGTGDIAHRVVWSSQERKRLAMQKHILERERQVLQLFQSVINHVADAIVTVNTAQRVTWMNAAAESLFFKGKPPDTLPALPQLVPDFSERNGVLFGEAHVDGNLIPIEATATAMRIGQEDFTNYVFRDVAARRESERQKDAFIAAMNHELRTPLTSIMGSLGLALSGVVGTLPDETAELIRMAHKNSETLHELVNDLLDATKIEAGQMTLNLSPTPLETFLRETQNQLLGYGSRYKIAITLLPVPPAIQNRILLIDRLRIAQALGNLVSNAVKYSPPDGDVRIHASPSSRKGYIQLSVSDDGPGIPATFHPHLFDRFAMLQASDGMARTGTGLGLTITKNIIEAHGGEIGFETETGVGTTFYFDLPIHTPQQP